MDLIDSRVDDFVPYILGGFSGWNSFYSILEWTGEGIARVKIEKDQHGFLEKSPSTHISSRAYSGVQSDISSDTWVFFFVDILSDVKPEMLAFYLIMWV